MISCSLFSFVYGLIEGIKTLYDSLIPLKKIRVEQKRWDKFIKVKLN